MLKNMYGVNNTRFRQGILIYRQFTLALLIYVCLLPSTSAEAPTTTSIGRQIYHSGQEGNQKIPAILPLTGETINAADYPCANCHGQNGEGATEGGLKVPTLSQAKLKAQGYVNRNTLKQALVNGRKPDNQALNPIMPRYQLSETQIDFLLTYLNQLGNETYFEDGVTESTIQLATLLPLTGAQAELGHLLKSTLDACLKEQNQHLFYGRQLKLSVIDSSARGSQTRPEAILNTVDTGKPFALVAPFLPEANPALYDALASRNIPVIAPLTFSPPSATPHPAMFFFLPSYAQQAETLLDYWLSANNGLAKNIILLHTDNNINISVAAHIKTWLSKRNRHNFAEINLTSTSPQLSQDQIATLTQLKPEAVLFLGTNQVLREIGPRLTKLNPQPALLSLLTMLGTEPDAVVNLSEIYLASPFPAQSFNLDKLAQQLDQHNVALNNPALQQTSCTALNFTAEGIKRTGKNLKRKIFINELESIKKFSGFSISSIESGSDLNPQSNPVYILQLNPKLR